VSEGTISMCLIAKNERENVRPCLSSFGDHVDEIVFCDTGSRDGTVAEVKRVARELVHPRSAVRTTHQNARQNPRQAVQQSSIAEFTGNRHDSGFSRLV
jgi:glycosyltransferase involved in cell wall biosynthesis